MASTWARQANQSTRSACVRVGRARDAPGCRGRAARARPRSHRTGSAGRRPGWPDRPSSRCLGPGHQRGEGSTGPTEVAHHPQRVGVRAPKQVGLVRQIAPDDVVDKVDVAAGVAASEHGVAEPPMSRAASVRSPAAAWARAAGSQFRAPSSRGPGRSRGRAASGPRARGSEASAMAGTMTTSVCVLTRRCGTSTPALSRPRTSCGTGSRPVWTSSASHRSWLSGLATSTAATAARISGTPRPAGSRRRWR